MLTPALAASVVLVICAVFTARVAVAGFDERTFVMLSLSGFLLIVVLVAAYFGSLPVPAGAEMEDVEKLRDVLDGQLENTGLDRPTSS